MTIWAKNEPTALRRRCLVTVTDDGGYPVDPGIDFIAEGMVFVLGVNSPDADLATGTLTNVRRALNVAADVIESVDTGADTVAMTAHNYRTGDGPFDSDEVTGPVAIGGDIYAIRVDADTVAWATSPENAYADTRIALAGTETGATITKNASTKRGCPGRFIYEAPQVELDHNTTEMGVFVDGVTSGNVSCLLRNGGGAETVIAMSTEIASILDLELEDGHTVGDALRAVFRGEAAPYEIDGNEHIVKSIDGTKISHRGTVTESGRSGMVITDLTP